jgi:hypothetical protein
MPNTNKLAGLTISDLQDLESFKKWLRQHLEFYDDGKISNSHLLIYLDYIEAEVMDNQNIDKGYWLQLVKNLETKIRSFKRVEKSDEL